MRSALLLLITALTIHSTAQTDPRVFTPYTKPTTTPAELDTPARPDSGHVVIHQSERITALMKSYAGTRQPLKGYRVQLYLGDRTKAEEIRRAFILKHPEIPAYLSYLAPNFRVRAGDLRTKLEAELLRNELKEEHPGLYVVPDEIEMPRLPDKK